VFRFYNLDETIQSILKLRRMDKPVCMNIQIENNYEINMQI